jgi:hypothetical protein
MRQNKSKSSFTTLILTQSIAILVFVLVPVLVTSMAPRSTIELRRFNGTVSAEVTRHTLLYVPIYRTIVEPLLDAESIRHESRSIKEDRTRNRKAATQIADGSVLLIGKSCESKVQSTYDDAPVQTQQIKAFIEDPSAETVMITANAPWMLTYVLGGIMTGLAVLYCAGSILAIARFFILSLLPGRRSS